MKKCQEPRKKIAFVHDFLVSYGGAERVLESLIKLDAEAPIYTLLYDAELMKGRFEGREIKVSFLQKLPKFIRKRYRWLLPLYPVAAESFDLREYDVVVSSSGAWAKGIVTRLRTLHIAYLHSPMRLLWDANERYLDMVRAGTCGRFLGRIYLSYLRVWDREAADRPDILVSNSEYTRSRSLKYYRRDSDVIYPPVTLEEKGDSVPAREDFFLVVSRLTESKGIDIVISAFNKLKLPLRIVGEGVEYDRLRKMAEANVVFLGGVDDVGLALLYRRAKAVVVPSEEDFGMAAAEAVKFKTPAIVLSQGGTAEIVEQGRTGEYFDAVTPEVIADSVRRFLDRGRETYVFGDGSTTRFSEERFLDSFRSLIGRTDGSDISV
ncbi:MAG: glycosyltransferase family 4 protein [Candidatus Moranbacteria bacterium]|nr:glycosyltransferase family 4 protein [Candidatus Moranbacteria bacterium]NTW75368.1 glycosyltransferase family 4 protein [Candidatus Moranbacteria bacterium]